MRVTAVYNRIYLVCSVTQNIVSVSVVLCSKTRTNQRGSITIHSCTSRKGPASTSCT